MDLQAMLAKFFDEKGRIILDPRFTLAGLSEMVFLQESASPQAEAALNRPVLRGWDFASNPQGVPRDFTRAQVNTRIKAVAARLQQVAQPGDRAAILAGNTPEYLFAFLGALYAGLVPVTLYDPKEPGHAAHLKAVFQDSNPSLVLTDKISAPAVRAYFAEIPGAERPRILSVDTLPDTLAASWQPHAPAGDASVAPVDTTAFLQYTSGSTRTPAGVELTNRSIVSNVLQIFASARLQTPLRMVSWIPLHHDMGIILNAFCLILGLPTEIMAPRDFVQRPSRWVEAIADRPEAPGVSVYTVVPNFALQLAAKYAAPEEGTTFTDVAAVIVGSEPVTKAAVDEFLATFTPHGFAEPALRPSYGLAEASLLVTTPLQEQAPVLTGFDREALAEGRAEIVPVDSESGVVFVSNGQPAVGVVLAVVDPETRQELPDGQIGELWMWGPNKAAGYLGRPEESAATFENTLAGALGEGSHIPSDLPAEGWLATGDLGMYLDGQVYITGRLKDLIVIAGRNHYPQDIEYTAAHASERLNPAAVAAFSVEGDDVEQLIILAERAIEVAADEAADAAAATAVVAAVNAAHGVAPADVRIMNPGEIARSSSAKIARRVAQKRYVEESQRS